MHREIGGRGDNGVPSWASPFLYSSKMGCCPESSQDRVMTQEEYNWARFLKQVFARSWVCWLCSDLSGVVSSIFITVLLAQLKEKAFWNKWRHFPTRWCYILCSLMDAFPPNWKMFGWGGNSAKRIDTLHFAHLVTGATTFWLNNVWRMGSFAYWEWELSCVRTFCEIQQTVEWNQTASLGMSSMTC